MFNDEYSWSLDEFNSAFDFPCGGERDVPRSFTPHIFWREISDQMENYDPSKSKASTLPNPNFKYFHRVMANTIFGRGESDGVVRSSELLMLWAAIEGVHLDSGSHFARHLMKIGRGASGSIVIGGLLTRIAIILGCDIDSLETVTRSPKINLETCLAMKWMKKEEGQYLLVLKDRFPLPLPCPTNTTIQNRGNWLMSDSVPIPPPMDLPPPPAPRREPTRHSFSVGSSAGPSSAFDFSEFRSSFERMQSDFAEQREFLQDQARTSDERYQRVEQFMERSENFYSQAADYFQAEEYHRQRQIQEWEREEEHRLRMQHTSERFTQMYDYHVRLGSLPRMPPFPPPS